MKVQMTIADAREILNYFWQQTTPREHYNALKYTVEELEKKEQTEYEKRLRDESRTA